MHDKYYWSLCNTYQRKIKLWKKEAEEEEDELKDEKSVMIHCNKIVHEMSLYTLNCYN